ncbi:hypothetical protein G7067_12255 [Leucobacter insecticola]|uniref:Uncharacterized protein n=1 Tax=Leucobacter insecticola TaxID=2714934 RepID=A0A6G8FL43_9MICO|nr:hypothetical protein [Leucobacter insecticola]QIM17003.1 hypothetical protein G7067_12255 [Leucobacter insecticola]
MVFAKVVLIVALLVAIGFGALMRARAWLRRRAEAKTAWEAEAERNQELAPIGAP